MYNPLTGLYDDRDDEIEKARKLKSITLSEVSLVSKPSNKQKFLIIKNLEGAKMDGLIKFFKSLSSGGLLSETEENTVEESLEILKDLGDAQANAVGDLITIIGRNSDAEFSKNSAILWPSLLGGF